MRLFRNILLSALLIFSSVGYSQNSLISNGTNSIKVGNSWLYFPTLGFTNTYSLLFDGVNENVRVTNPTEINVGTGDFTFSAWIKRVVTGATHGILAKDAFNDDFEWRVATTGVMEIYIAGLNRVSAVDVDNTNWHYVAITRISGNIQHYVDGNVSSTLMVNAGSIDNSHDLYIGIRGSGSIPFNGNIDEVSIWDAGLILSEIQEIYNSGTPTNLLNHSANADLISWWRMGDGDTFFGGNWTITDQKANNDGTSVNMEEADRESVVP